MKSCGYGEYGSYEHLLFLFYRFLYKCIDKQRLVEKDRCSRSMNMDEKTWAHEGVCVHVHARIQIDCSTTHAFTGHAGSRWYIAENDFFVFAHMNNIDQHNGVCSAVWSLGYLFILCDIKLPFDINFKLIKQILSYFPWL